MGIGLHLRRWALRSAALLAGAVAIMAPHSAAAQSKPTASAQALAAVVRPLSFFRVQDLSFGLIVPGTTSGQVRVLPDGTRTSTGGVILAGANHRPARFAGRGTYNQNVRIRVGSGTINVTGPGGRQMTVSNFELGSSPNTTILTNAWGQFSIGAVSGIFNFPIGGRLDVNANQMPGNYTGTFSVSLEYQ